MSKRFYFLWIALLAIGLSVSAQKLAINLAKSEMQRNPDPTRLDFQKAPKWDYATGLELLSIYKVSDQTGDSRFANYAQVYLDSLIAPDGRIRGYKVTEYNIDNLNAGKLLFQIYRKNKDLKIKNVLDTLRSQMLTHPRTSEGSFWHKKIYTHQVWLDGLYMAAPFLAEYGKMFNEPALFDDMAAQLVSVRQLLKDEKTGLYFHGWDESKEQKWADPQTGRSPNFWSRSIGWYMMALVDALDYIPENHSLRPQIIEILRDLSADIEKFRDPKTGMWYQVTNMQSTPGNYLESSGSSMFVYTWVKAAQKGYIDKSYLKKGKKAYKQLVKTFIKKHPDGTISITNCCAVAGLGGKPRYRDGSFQYYISEPVRDNDPKSVGPFILLSLLLNQ